MRQLHRLWSMSLLLIPCLAYGEGGPPPATTRVGVLFDGPSWYFEELVDLVEQEVTELAESPVEFVRDPRFNANWEIERITDILSEALTEDDLDLILAAGMLMAQAAAAPDLSLSKPVVAGFPQDSALSHFETKENFSFVISRERVTRDVAKMRDLFDFDTLWIAIDRLLAEHLEGVQPLSEQLAAHLDIPVHLIPVDDDPEAALKGIPSDAQVLYITPLLRMNADARTHLFDGLAERGVLSFSLLGELDVQHGALSGITPLAQTRLARRIALNLLALADGRLAETLPREFNVPEHLIFNEDTVRRTGYRQTLGIMLQTSLIEDDARGPEGEPLSLIDALHIGLSLNTRIAAAAAQRLAAVADQRQARAVLWPQIEGQALYAEIDQDRAAASFGLQPRSRLSAGATARQILFHDRVFSQLRAAGMLAERSRWEAESQRLDVVQHVSLRFFDALSAAALVRVATDELDRIRDNLEFARLRVDVGQTGPEDVWRWEAEEARQLSELLAAQAQLNAARAALNQAMGLPADREWHLEAVELDDLQTYFLDDELAFARGDFQTIAALGTFWEQMALQTAPQLQALDAALEAQTIQANATRRSRYVPTVGVQATYDHVLDRRTEGPDLAAGFRAAGIPFQATPPPDNEWSVALVLDIPLFDGGLRRAEAARERADLMQLQAIREEAAQQIQLGVIAAYQQVMASQPAIRLSRTRARAARDSMTLIQERYQQGTAGILELLDVQGRAFAADQAAVLAVNQYLQDLTRFQRSIAWFAWLQSPADRQQLADDVHTFLETQP